MVRLAFLTQPFDGQVYELTREEITVGRSAHNNLVIPSDSVSARHCSVLVWGSEVIVRDLDSANGTFVNEVRVDQQSGVKSGQVIRFGEVEARLEIDCAPEDEDDAEDTAIHQHVRFTKARQQEKKRTEAMPLIPHGDALARPEEQTVLFRREPPPRAATDLPRPGSDEFPGGSPVRKGLALKAALALLALGLLVWLALSLGGR